MARIRTIGSHSEVSHNWASRVPTGTAVYRDGGAGTTKGYHRGETSPRCRYYYDGDLIYSYGPHYVVGKLLDTPTGTIALLNQRKWETTVADSPTTKRHRREAEDAVRRAGIPRVHVQSLHAETGLRAALSQVCDTLKYALSEYTDTRSLYRKLTALADMRQSVSGIRILLSALGVDSTSPFIPDAHIDHDTTSERAKARWDRAVASCAERKIAGKRWQNWSGQPNIRYHGIPFLHFYPETEVESNPNWHEELTQWLTNCVESAASR